MKPKNKKKKNVLRVSHRLVLKLGVSLFYSKDAFNDWACFFLLKICFHLLGPCVLVEFQLPFYDDETMCFAFTCT
jgi:hypothetical protein